MNHDESWNYRCSIHQQSPTRQVSEMVRLAVSKSRSGVTL